MTSVINIRDRLANARHGDDAPPAATKPLPPAAPPPTRSQWRHQTVLRLGQIFMTQVRPQILSGVRAGRPALMDVRQVMCDDDYVVMRSALDVISGGMPRMILKGRRTEYWRSARTDLGLSRRKIWRKLVRFRKLLPSLAAHGFIYAGDLRSLPWIVVLPRFTIRFDGNHRVSAWRYLGNRDVPVLSFTADDLLGANLTDEDRRFVAGLCDAPAHPDFAFAPPRELALDNGALPPDGLLLAERDVGARDCETINTIA